MSETESEEEYSEIEDEPRLKYRRLGNDVLAILRQSEICSFFSNDRFIAIGTSSGFVSLFDHEGNKIQDVWEHKGACLCITIDEKGEIVASCSEDGQVKITSLYGDSDLEQKMKFRSAVYSIALSTDYTDSGKIIIGSDKITLCEKGLLGSKKTSTLSMAVAGKISKIDWTFLDYIVWADEKDVKIFDVNRREMLLIIPRQNSELNPCHFKCDFFWTPKNQLIVSWGDYVQVCNVKSRAGMRKFEIQKMFNTKFMCSCISHIDGDLLVLSFEGDGKPATRIINVENNDYREISFDTLTMREFTKYKSSNYILSKIKDQNNYFIVSPKDIIVAIEPDDEDHLIWLMENKQFVEALEFCDGRKFKNYTYNSIGREYIRHLIANDSLQLAAEKCQSFLFTNDEWEKEALAFASKSALKTLVPYLPVKEPKLRSTIYGEALREILEAKQYDDYLKWVMMWPSAIYEIKQQVFLLYQELNQTKSKDLSNALAILLENDQRYEDAFKIFLKLKDPEIFNFIERRLLYSKDWIKNYILHLMKIDSTKCTSLFIDRKEYFEIKSIVEILKADTRLLHSYLHNLYIRDNKLPAQFHDLQVILYACYDRQKLLPFLKSSTHYEEREALKVVKNKGFQDEEVYLLARMGNKSEALNLLLSSADSINSAVEFCLDQADNELWLELIDLSIVNPKFIKDLLKIVGNYVNPLVIIERIPEGMEIPQMRDALQIVLRDATDRQRMWKSAEIISAQDGLGLIKRLFQTRSMGQFMEKGAESKCDGCSNLLIENGKIRGRHISVFGCGHQCHSDCAIDHSKLESSLLRTSISSNSSFVMSEKCPACERL